MNEIETSRGNQKAGNSGEPEAFPKHWFCVALPSSGGTFRTDAESPAGFLETVESSAIAWVDYRTDDFDKDTPLAAAQLGFSDLLISSLTGGSRLTYQDFDTEMGLKLPSIQVRHFKVTPHPLLIFLRKNFLLTIHPLNVDRRFTRLRRYADTVLRKIPAEACAADRRTILLTRIIDENNDRNFEHLREIEERGGELNEDMMDPATPREKLGPEIYKMKHALITYLNALWETMNVLHALRYGDAELITDDPKLLEKVGILIENVNRQLGLAEHMSEVLASGLEVLQTIYNNQLQALNNRLALVMTYFTIVGTAVLVPNTLATIFGSSAFGLGTKDLGWYAALLFFSTVLSTVLVYWWVRKRGWIPKKMD